MADNYLQFSFELTGPEWSPEACGHLINLIDVTTDEIQQSICTYQKDVNGLWMHADEYGEPYQLAVLIQKTMRKFKMKRAVAFTWATTCSKMRVDEFSGGGVVVRPNGIRIINGDTAYTKAAAWNQKHASKQGTVP